MSAPIRLVVIGAGGRMGRNLLRLLPEFAALELCAAVVPPASKDLGRRCDELAGLSLSGGPAVPGFGALRTSSDLAGALSTAGLAIDFSSAAASPANLAACVSARVPLLLGTTGLADSLQPRLEQAAARIPLLVAANTSLAVSLLLELVRRAAEVLPDSFDIEISEAHHRDKRDAPSGTALALGAAAQAGRGRAAEGTPAVHGPQSAGVRPVGEVAYAVTRGGDLVGEHTVHFIGAGERLVLGHVATDRAIFARGALTAGVRLAGQPPGRYRMQDLSGEK
jgi:4-hydroxy-tetrahydrodipicolinate reductase